MLRAFVVIEKDVRGRWCGSLMDPRRDGDENFYADDHDTVLDVMEALTLEVAQREGVLVSTEGMNMVLVKDPLVEALRSAAVPA